MLRWLLCFASCGFLAACSDVAVSPMSNPAERHVSDPPRFSVDAAVTYPLHWYGDASDSWPYTSPTAPVYVEIPADDQTPHADDGPGRRVCPNDQMFFGFNAHLRMNYGLETLDLDFRSPFSFIRHVSTTSPYPTAAYRFHRNAYSRDNKYYAPANNQVLLACNGYYVVENRVMRTWVGYLYGKNYTGDIVRNPEYEEPGSGGGCGDGAEPEVDNLVTDNTYDPYDSGPVAGGEACAGGGEGGGGTQYEPGQYTGGQTVEWETGRGTGRPSACGDNAKVEWICIDVWDEASGTWVEWSCGYATTC
jgi:hypothetical protein